MKFYFGLYDTGHYWDTRDMSWEVEYNKYVIDEVWNTYGEKYKSSEAGILARKSAAIPKELSVHFIPWETMQRCIEWPPYFYIPLD